MIDDELGALSSRGPKKPAQTAPSREPEVLAPAGDTECLRAALAAGADAVYFGLDVGFNARARAENFTLEGLPETVAQIHRSGAKAYLTVNTLIFEGELERVVEVIRAAARSGVDALIVQDPAVALLARSIAPRLHLHASTQMTISTPEAARFAGDLGVDRVVVPRELSLAEIDAFQKATSLELEVFVHGALCVSWSGQCLTSEAWSGRSANRGQCAQSCRLPYTLIVDGSERDLGDVKYLLSPKDLAGGDAIPSLRASGVAGLKIEGRQKGVAYVATAVAGYRRLVDALRAGVDEAAAKRAFESDLRSMSLAYTRGFSHGFFHGSDHQTLVEGRFPKHRGVLLGRVSRVERNSVVLTNDPDGRPWTGALALESRPAGPAQDARSVPPRISIGDFEVEPGMGVVFDSGNPEDKHEPGGPVFAVDRTRGGDVVLRFGQPGPDLTRVRAGMRVWATSDPREQREAVKLAERFEPSGRLPVALRAAGEIGQPLEIEVEFRGIRHTVRSSIALAAARGAGLDEALLRDKLGTFGGTPFRLEAIDTEALVPGTFVPVSELKELKRAVIAQLESMLVHAPDPGIRDDSPLVAVRERLRAHATIVPGPIAPYLVPLCRNEAQVEAAIDSGVPEVELDFMELVGLKRAVESVRAAGRRVVIATLRVDKPLETAFFDGILAMRPDALLVRHWSGLERAREIANRPRLLGDFSLNVTNSLTALLLLGRDLDGLTPAYDLDEEQLASLLDATRRAGSFTLPLYHRVPAFHTEHCVYSHLLSNGRDHRTCGRPCEGHAISLRDDRKHEHPVIVDAGCRNTVFDGKPQSCALALPDLLRRGVMRFRIEFLRESAQDVVRVLAASRELLFGEISPQDYLRRVAARSQIGVAEGRMKTLLERGT